MSTSVSHIKSSSPSTGNGWIHSDPAAARERYAKSSTSLFMPKKSKRKKSKQLSSIPIKEESISTKEESRYTSSPSAKPQLIKRETSILSPMRKRDASVFSSPIKVNGQKDAAILAGKEIQKTCLDTSSPIKVVKQRAAARSAGKRIQKSCLDTDPISSDSDSDDHFQLAKRAKVVKKKKAVVGVAPVESSALDEIVKTEVKVAVPKLNFDTMSDKEDDEVRDEPDSKESSQKSFRIPSPPPRYIYSFNRLVSLIISLK
jgi:hypothetical protein